MHFSRERECVFWLIIGLGKEWGAPTRHSHAWAKLDLEAIWVWWSVGEGGEGDAFSSLP